MPSERLEVDRIIPAEPHAIFEVLRSPQGHVSIDSSGMLMCAEGDPATKAGDTFLVHMDRDSLRDFPLDLYDVTVSFTKFEPDRAIEWTILTDFLNPPLGHVTGTSSRGLKEEHGSRRTTTGPLWMRRIADASAFRSSPRTRFAPPSASSLEQWHPVYPAK
jgi:hypothetical protein